MSRKIKKSEETMQWIRAMAAELNREAAEVRGMAAKLSLIGPATEHEGIRIALRIAAIGKALEIISSNGGAR